MSARHLSPRAIRQALELLLQLPAEALEDLAERILDRLDATRPDPDAEPDQDGEADDDEPDQDGACEAGDDDPASSRPLIGVHGVLRGPGDPADAEDADPAEANGDAEPSPQFIPRHYWAEAIGVSSWTDVVER